MMAVALPMALLCAALGLALGFAPLRAGFWGMAALVSVSVTVMTLPLPPRWQEPILLALWASTVLTALTVYRPRSLGKREAIVLGVNAGLWVGAVAATSGSTRDLGTALLAAFLFLPGGIVVRRGWGIAVKVAASWTIAISVLAAVVSLTPHPGYKPDHMD